MANTVQRSRKLMFYEDWTAMGLVAGGIAGLFIPQATVLASALTGGFLGFYTSFSVRNLRDKKLFPEQAYEFMNFTTKDLTGDA